MSSRIAGPYCVEFNTSIAAEEFAFKKGDRFSVNKHLFDAWRASGICHAVDSIDDPEVLKKQIADLQERLANAGKKK